MSIQISLSLLKLEFCFYSATLNIQNIKLSLRFSCDSVRLENELQAHVHLFDILIC